MNQDFIWTAVTAAGGFTAGMGKRITRMVCIVQRRQFGSGSVMVWGGITARNRTLYR